MSVVYALNAYPAGQLSDRMRRTTLLAIGLATLDVADVALALAAPAEHRGTASGVFNLVSGLALLAASVLAGLLWDRHGPAGTFWTGAG